ncbi:AAA family ATPase [Wolbachia endosymbiont (group B) of Catoptria pinella]|uniref:AAA family ATPase n=1 Tax=Wolbachia endosymbiont (group B) of Catoptria pinella TaxID=2953993 RepID=UPI00222700A6|nr:AAA family ATPase [Wolbachia endosymbiont (group B) of Catoptria pinella]
MTSDQLLAEVLSIINDKTDLNEDNIIQEIQEELEKQNQDLHEEWKKVKFDVNHLFSQELTLLHVAARGGFENVAKVLVAGGADVNKKDSKREKIPLHLAAENGHVEVVEFFLNKGISVNVMDKEGNTPLHYAADNGSRKTISILIRKNADPWLKNFHGKTPVNIYAFKHPNGSGYLMQLKKAKIQGYIVFGSMLLLGAAMATSIVAVNLIVPDVPVLKVLLCVSILYAFASIAKYITYKAAELDAKNEIKNEQDSNIINIEEVSDEKKSVNKATRSKKLNDLVCAIKGSSRIEIVDPDKQKKVTLDDVIVSEEVRKELKMICGHISEKKKKALEMLSCKMPTGYILYGPPGNGKTLIARAIACEASAKFISVSGSECMQKYAGHSAHYIKDLFAKARENAPCIVFIDEIDAVCTKRSNSGRSDEEHNRIVNQFLCELDGFNPIEGVTIIAATNRLESLDEAVIRSGRLSKHIEILLPDKSLREKILGLYTEKVPMAPDVNLAKLAEETNGFSGADLENLVNEAKLHAVDQICEEESEDEELKVTVNMDDFNNVLKDLKSKKVEVKNENEAVNDFIEFCKNISKCTGSSKDSSYLAT